MQSYFAATKILAEFHVNSNSSTPFPISWFVVKIGSRVNLVIMSNKKANNKAVKQPTSILTITEEVDKFLSQVEVRPFLFYPSCEGYKNRDLRRVAWDQIGGDQAKKKYEGLRDTYNRKKRKRVPTGSAPEKATSNSFMARLSFLDQFVKHRKTSGNYESQFEDEDNEENRNENLQGDDERCSNDDNDKSLSDSGSVDSQNIQSPPQTKRQRKSKHKKTVDDELRSQILKMVDTPDDEDEHYGISIANDIKNLSPRKKAFAKAKIQQALYEATLQNHDRPVHDYPNHDYQDQDDFRQNSLEAEQYCSV